MKKLSANQIRDLWFEFFKQKHHQLIASASLIPQNDPTLLWVNAGIAPLKKYFDGSVVPLNRRLVNVQKCIRTNDIDNAGITARHHTFFEMLGNFSIGDYFKKEAIEYAYELLTDEKWFGFNKDDLYITYYPGDDVCKNTWIKCGIDEKHLIALKQNFWEIGPGPSGPCTEIFVDRGPAFHPLGAELIADDIENDRFIEIYNIVFSQYNADPNISRDKYLELPNKNIDTGAGLERIAAILQGAKTNYETDLFYPIIEACVDLAQIKYNGQMAYKVIADHIKTLTMAISDGAILSNEGRGYVLRRILRRAIKFGRQLKFDKPFLHLLVDAVVVIMHKQYPEVLAAKEIVKQVIFKEEEKFFSTIADGEKLLKMCVNNQQISAKDAFKLYDTFGFPIELTLEYAQENQIDVDIEGFNIELEKQRQRSRGSRDEQASMGLQDEKMLNFDLKSKYVGYEKSHLKAKVIAMFDNGVVLDQTPFYATAGGQVFDMGTINGINVLDVVKMPNGQFLHTLAKNELKVGQKVDVIVDIKRQEKVRKNHTATHLLHQALKDILGEHVNQQGSLVSDNLLRFDFNHYQNLTNDEILAIEKLVNEKIKADIPIDISYMSLDKAKASGAMALFSEKYDDVVRVVKIDNYSAELCGGLHVSNTKEIGKFAIGLVESIGSGIVRIEAFTDHVIIPMKKLWANSIQTADGLIEQIHQLKPANDPIKLVDFIGSYVDVINLRHQIETLQDLVKTINKEIAKQKAQDILSNVDSLIPANYTSKEVIVVDGLDTGMIKQVIDTLFDKMKAQVIILISNLEDKSSYAVKSSLANANLIIKEINRISEGAGGGRPEFAQGGTNHPDKLNENLDWIKKYL